jgi:nucleoside-diphosphate-sugar epimerase
LSAPEALDMSCHAFVLGGTGQIGQAVAGEFLRAGWSVAISHRGTRAPPYDLVARGAAVVTLDRNDEGALSAAIGAGADVLVDTTAYNGDHGRQLIAVQGSVGSFVVISSASVYRDDRGRTLDEAMRTGFPDLPNPIPEPHPTVEPGPATYSTRKVALERGLLDGATTPVTILRPCAVHGLHSRHPREWWVVKRVLDRRPAIPLAYRGISRFHTTAVANIARLTRIVAGMPGSRILNVADPDTPSVAVIADLITHHLGYEGRIVGLDDPGYPPTIGTTPWSVPLPFVLDCGAALGLGYTPATTFADAVGGTCDWLTNEAADGDWTERYPVLAAYPRDHFDYAAEDAFFGAQR